MRREVKGVLEDRVAVVTGAGRGIGRALALELARQGAKVIVNDAGVDPEGRGHDAKPANAVRREIEDAGGIAISNDADVSSWSGGADIVDTSLANFGRLDILVNNAGIARFRRFDQMTEEQWDAVVDVHLKGTFNCCRHAVPHMIDQGYGRIVNITSAAAQGFVVQANYVAAKAGIIGLTFALALELADHNITVNAFAPSGFTRLLAAMRPPADSGAPPGTEAAANGPIVAWLASEAAGHVNGQIFGWGGGKYQLFEQILKPAVTFSPASPATVADFIDDGARVFSPFLQPVGRTIDAKTLAEFVARVDRDQ
jgi:NAD(P)-dependent dehydrogenase (short-subunit alcohol dehydrogenase family)